VFLSGGTFISGLMFFQQFLSLHGMRGCGKLFVRLSLAADQMIDLDNNLGASIGVRNSTNGAEIIVEQDSKSVSMELERSMNKSDRVRSPMILRARD